MTITKHLVENLAIGDRYIDILKDVYGRYRLHTTVRILVVTDGPTTGLGPGEFGMGMVIDLIRNSSVGCMNFVVDIAVRDATAPTVVVNPAPTAAKYTGFRFDMTNAGALVIDQYQQIWIFAINPNSPGGPDTDIDLAGNLPVSNAELAKLAHWMDARKGGIFATGDHDFLGASICHKIPRIGTMRRWTRADGVPPISHIDRIDTLRPPSPAYMPGAPGGPLPLDNIGNQGDLTPQPINWVPWQTVRTSWLFTSSRPHPVLCHPTLGPIDVMPDHAHEGLCRDTGTVVLTNNYDFDGTGSKPEYPLTGSGQPAPTVIAYGSTLGSPPYNFTKGPQPARASFPMISVYDGHLAGVGRVATDSTWHHWFNLNLAAMKTENGSHWAKISRYFINLAVWLAPPGYSTNCLWWCTLLSNFTAVGLQEYSHYQSDFAMGQALYVHLSRVYGPCWVSHVLIDILNHLELRAIEEPHLPIPPECLTCPPWQMIEFAALGGLVRATLPIAAEIHAAVSEGTQKLDHFDDKFTDTMHRGVRQGIAEMAKNWRNELQHSERVLAQLSGEMTN